MNKIFLLSLATAAMMMTACGGGKQSDGGFTPETTSVKGDLGKYYTVVEKDYTIDNGSMSAVVSVDVVRTDVPFEFDIEGVEPMGYHGQGVRGNAGFGIEILDEKGNVIEKAAATAGGLGGMYSGDDMIEALKLQPGETATVRWSFNFDDKKPAKFRLTSALDMHNSTSSDSEVKNESDSEVKNEYARSAASTSRYSFADPEEMVSEEMVSEEMYSEDVDVY